MPLKKTVLSFPRTPVVEWGAGLGNRFGWLLSWQKPDGLRSDSVPGFKSSAAQMFTWASLGLEGQLAGIMAKLYVEIGVEVWVLKS